jgi:hypothetical protein
MIDERFFGGESPEYARIATYCNAIPSWSTRSALHVPNREMDGINNVDPVKPVKNHAAVPAFDPDRSKS